ncbi:hypothetical protein [Roseibacillus ishigakijimensis]|uniref:Uncharacterized protein n=1 Tax=Roseibacillus ishigakijimensis TaxID=454146 RepID=A0A934RVF1_9BACT|nr:hypothetical protein [Roseibacillus ishigakijimensis]MBK1834885.1 hypothetical protein [Roseibacillus ishigakijimensis]
MARSSHPPKVRGKWGALVIGLLSLFAAESFMMLAVSPLMKIDPGFIVLAGLFTLPLWATLLTLAYTVDQRGRYLSGLLAVGLGSTALLLIL